MNKRAGNMSFSWDKSTEKTNNHYPHPVAVPWSGNLALSPLQQNQRKRCRVIVQYRLSLFVNICMILPFVRIVSSQRRFKRMVTLGSFVKQHTCRQQLTRICLNHLCYCLYNNRHMQTEEYQISVFVLEPFYLVLYCLLIIKN